MVLIKGGSFSIGTNKPIIAPDGEAPERRIRVDNFYMDQFEVSNADFAHFVQQNGYQTDADKFGDSFVLYSLIKDAKTKEQNVSAVAAVPWWLSIPEANWRHPEGPESTILGYYMHYYKHFFVLQSEIFVIYGRNCCQIDGIILCYTWAGSTPWLTVTGLVNDCLRKLNGK